MATYKNSKNFHIETIFISICFLYNYQMESRQDDITRIRMNVMRKANNIKPYNWERGFSGLMLLLGCWWFPRISYTLDLRPFIVVNWLAPFLFVLFFFFPIFISMVSHINQLSIKRKKVNEYLAQLTIHRHDR